jgi:transcriptional regulator with GAF, ATPase, and Fis domain
LNIDRLLRDVESRLADRDEADRSEVMDVLREAVARERRWFDPSLTVEHERERRQNAEELRGALEAIHRSVRSAEALEEVLKQFDRVVPTDFAVLAVSEPGAGLRIAAVRGAELEVFAGALLADDPHIALAREERRVVAVTDVEADAAPFPLVGAPTLRSWMALPLLLEGDIVGMLVAGRQALDTFSNEDLQRAKAVASWTAATLRRVQQLDQLRRYATLLEQVADVDQRVFGGERPETLGAAIVEGACRVGSYRGGLLILQTPRGPVVAAAVGEAFTGAVGRAAPADLAATSARRLPAARMLDVAEALGMQLPAEQTYLVPLVTPDAYVGCLALVDPNGESPDDRLMEAYGSRTALAFRHAALQHARP